MFSDPASITIAGNAKSLPAVDRSDPEKGVYKTNDGAYTLTISHQHSAPGTSGETVRSLIRLDFKAVVSNPLDSTNSYKTLTTYLVVERPLVGFTSTNLSDQVTGFNSFVLTNIAKIFGEES